MPAGDVIFQRLEVATNGELKALAKALHEENAFEREHTRPEQHDFLSRHLRKDAGSALRTPLRDDHELSYFKILEDVVTKAASAASWSHPSLDEKMTIENIENYVLAAYACAKNEPAGVNGVENARKAAESRFLDSDGHDRSITIKTVGGIGRVLKWAVGPAVRRTLPAVLVLIHIRNRVRAQALLGRES